MFRYFLLVIACILWAGCEIKVREADSPFSLKTDSSRTRERARTTAPADTVQSQIVPPAPASANIPAAPPQSNMFDIVTPLGRMRIRLYDVTPLHRDNFKKLVAQGFYEGTTFHRVIRNFMIQGGDPNSRDNNPYNDGTGGPGYTTPAEIVPTLFHKRGALAAARQGDAYNPQRNSNGSQFYIVQGQVFSEPTLNEIEKYLASAIPQPDFRFSEAARETYTSIGGYPMLDRQYTIFGELVSGFDVLDRISAIPTDSNDRPQEDITISIRPVVAQ